MDGGLTVTVLRKRCELAPVVVACADLALHCIETSSLAQYRFEGTRCVLVWERAQSLVGLFPFGAPALYRDLPLVALKSPTPLLRRGRAHAALHALLDWFREDGEGAALLEFRAIRRGGPVYRALEEVAQQREQLVLATSAPDGSRTLIVGDRTWSELTRSTLPPLRWAKRAAASVIYAGGAEFAPL